MALGYEPWSAVGGEPLGDHHQACVRLHRADYCGDGRPYTVDGHLINLFDDLGIQEDECSGFSLESEWDEHGARCLSNPRIDGGAEPDCELPRCDSSPSWGDTLLVSEAP